MTDMLIQFGLSNALMSVGLALIAFGAGATLRNPRLSHTLWLFVFVVLLTPPLVTFNIAQPVAVDPATVAIQSFEAGAVNTGVSWSDRFVSTVTVWGDELALLWIFGAVLLGLLSLVRAVAFHRQLGMHAVEPCESLMQRVEQIGLCMGLRCVPRIVIVPADLSPLVWWMGGRPAIVLSRTIMESSTDHELTLILAHELAHVRRGDHMVRWIEWLASTLIWWNPIVWWARKSLRAHEELCCDALVVSTLEVEPRVYAESLFTTVQRLARPAHRPPAMASNLFSGGILERRFTMIVTGRINRTHSRWLSAGVIAAALVVLPLGVGCQDSAVSVDEELSLADEMTEEMNELMAKRPSDSDIELKAEIEHLAQRVHESIQNGSMTKEEGGRIMESMMQKLNPGANVLRRSAPAEMQEEHERLLRGKEELHRAIESGEITEEEAQRKLEELARRLEMDIVKRQARTKKESDN